MATIKNKNLKTKVVKKNTSIPKKQYGGTVTKGEPMSKKQAKKTLLETDSTQPIVLKSRKNINKTLIKDFDNNIVLSKKNTRNGREVEKIEFADRLSSGAKKEKAVTRPLLREIRKTNAMYEKYPKFAEEDSYTPVRADKGEMKYKGTIKNKMRNGGIVKKEAVSKKVVSKKPSKLVSSVKRFVKSLSKKK